MAKEKRFFSDFPPTTRKEWIEKITSDLKGTPFDKKLIWKSPEGFEVFPFYRREDIDSFSITKVPPATFPYVRSTKLNNSWHVCERVSETSPKKANERALYILNRGVTSLQFVMHDDWVNIETLEVLLNGIAIDAIELNFACCISRAVSMANALSGYCNKHNIPSDKIEGSIDYVPFKRELVRGKKTPNWLTEALQVLKVASCLPHIRVLMVNAYFLSNAGAYITEELGIALAWGVELLDTLGENGFSIEEVANKIKFNFGVGSNYFMEIAKFRAARWLWAEIIASHGEQYKGDVAKIHQHAITSSWNMTVYDAYVNLLRTQTEAMSAALGGVDSLMILPYDTPFSATPTDFSLRIARNQQLLLLEESHFDKVVDPAAGSYYIETLTQKIAEKAWSIFLDIQHRGGFAKLVQQGEIQQMVNASNNKRHEAVAKRRESLLGTNEFPNFTERAIDRVKANPQTAHHCSIDHSKEEDVLALDFRRAASDFENLRLATDFASHQPVVFMLTIGNLAMRLARSQFASNFFGCAGYKLIDNLGFDSVEQGVVEAFDKKADIIVLCSSDDEYEQYAPEAFKLVGERCNLVIAGNPACREQLETLGIKHFIHVKSNVLETLQHFNELLVEGKNVSESKKGVEQ